MQGKKDLNKEELEKVTGGDYGRQWNISQFRQDYATNNTTDTNSTSPCDTKSKSDDVDVTSDFFTSKN